MKYCYSTNGEEFNGEFDTIKDALCETMNCEDSGTVWIGEIVHATEFINGKCLPFAGTVVENIDEYLYDCVGGEEATVTMGASALEEFGEMIFAFVKENADFHRWGVKNVKRYEI